MDVETVIDSPRLYRRCLQLAPSALGPIGLAHDRRDFMAFVKMGEAWNRELRSTKKNDTHWPDYAASSAAEVSSSAGSVASSSSAFFGMM